VRNEGADRIGGRDRDHRAALLVQPVGNAI
jgi:hypothetical protein